MRIDSRLLASSLLRGQFAQVEQVGHGRDN
jgi:hypothetical protein